MASITQIEQKVDALAVRIADEIDAVRAEIAALPGGGGVTTLDWASVTGKPSTFPPSAHTHVAADVTDFSAAADARIAAAGLGGAPSWASITGKPSTFPPSAHTHVAADVTDFVSVVDARITAAGGFGGGTAIYLSGYGKALRNVVCNGTTTLTKTTDANSINDEPFSAGMVGKSIAIMEGGTASVLFTTTVAGYTSPTQITLAAAPPNSVTTRAFVYTDSTAELTAALAIDDAVVEIKGPYCTGPVTWKQGQTIRGVGENVTTWFLKPGSASVNKYLLKNANATDHQQGLYDLTMNGLRDFQKDGSNNVITDIALVNYAGGGDTPIVDAYNCYFNLRLTESGIGLKYTGKGESKFAQINIDRCTYGFDINAFDLSFTGCNATAYGTAWKLGSSVSSCRFTACKGFFAGYAPPSGAFGALEYCCWALNGSSWNEFSACEGQESWGDVWVLQDAKGNLFTACRGADPGCVYPAHGTGSSNAGVSRVGWRFLGASHYNRFAACTSGARVHGTTNYGTYAVLVEGTSTGNTGEIDVEGDLAAYATATIGYTSSGVNKLTVNEARVDGVVSTSTFAATLLDDADATAARGTLDIYESYTVAVSDESTALATGASKITFRAPYACTHAAVPRSSINTVSSSGLVTVDVNIGGATMLSTKLSIDQGEKTSKTAATAAVMLTSAWDDDDEITIDIDAAGTGAKGLKVTFFLRRI